MPILREALVVLVQEGLIERRHGSGTYRTDRTHQHAIGVLMDLDISHPGTSPYFLRVMQQVRGFLEKAGYQVKLYTGRQDPTTLPGELTCHEFIEDVQANQVGGVVAVSAIPHPSWTDLLNQRGIPIVGLGNKYEYRVLEDMAHFTREAVALMVKHDRRKIALMGWTWSPESAAKWDDCYAEPFRPLLKEQGLMMNEAWIWRGMHPSHKGAGWEAFRDIWFSGADKPDGIVIIDDLLFRDAVIAIQDLWIRVPEELLVVTMSSKHSGILSPFPVIKLEYDSEEVARNLVRLLTRRLERQPVESKTILMTCQTVADGLPGTTKAEDIQFQSEPCDTSGR